MCLIYINNFLTIQQTEDGCLNIELEFIMKIELVKNENGLTIGYKMIAETSEDTPIIEQVRDMYFWGYEQTKVEYDGRVSANDKNDTTTEIRFKLACFKKKNGIRKRKK